MTSKKEKTTWVFKDKLYPKDNKTTIHYLQFNHFLYRAFGRRKTNDEPINTINIKSNLGTEVVWPTKVHCVHRQTASSTGVSVFYCYVLPLLV